MYGACLASSLPGGSGVTNLLASLPPTTGRFDACSSELLVLPTPASRAAPPPPGRFHWCLLLVKTFSFSSFRIFTSLITTWQRSSR